jgi:hypothetical protein
MIDHAASREAVILRMLLESGARVSEVLALTAGGLRRAQNPKIGIDVAALVRNKGEHSESKAIWCSLDTREHLRRYIARERSKLDPEITLEMWEAWGSDIDVMRTQTGPISKYAAAVNFHTPAYVERLSPADRVRIGHLLLPPLRRHFRERFVPMAEHRAAQRRRRKAKTDVLSERATAILALMLARYPSAERFVRWYRHQIERIDRGELNIPAHLVYDDEQLDLPHEPGPDAASIEEVQWRKLPVRLELTIWRPYEFSFQRYTDWMNQTKKGSKS